MCQKLWLFLDKNLPSKYWVIIYNGDETLEFILQLSSLLGNGSLAFLARGQIVQKQSLWIALSLRFRNKKYNCWKGKCPILRCQSLASLHLEISLLEATTVYGLIPAAAAV